VYSNIVQSEVERKMKLTWRKTQGENAPKRKRARGQGMVETALLFPVLLIVLSGMVEFGFMLNDYLSIMDATRNAARFSSDSDWTTVDNEANLTLNSYGYYSCDQTIDFYRQTLCLVCMNIDAIRPPLAPYTDPDIYRPGEPVGFKYKPSSGSDEMVNCPLDPSRDQIIITTVSVTLGDGSSAEPALGGMPRGAPFPSSSTGEDARRIGYDDIKPKLDPDAPSTGYLVVELFYNYDQRLALPWIRAFIPDPVLLHTYAIMPLVSAEPR